VSRKPTYPVEQNEGAGSAPEKPVEFKFPPDDLYSVPSFKFRHVVRAPHEGGDTAYRRAHPEFYAPLPRRLRRRG
jgi:hypothetical protein